MNNQDSDAPGFLGHPVNDSKSRQVMPIVTDADLKQMDSLRALYDGAVVANAHVMIDGQRTRFAAEVLELWASERGIVLERERIDPPATSTDPRPYVTFRASSPGGISAGYCISIMAARYL